MTTIDLQQAPVLVVGAGIMGSGIAQVAAQAGHPVFLFDTRDGAADEAKARLGTLLAGLVAKGRVSGDAAQATLARITPVAGLQQAASARLVVEAIVEQLAAKRALFQQLEALLADDAVLASNTSSISITAMANGLQRPGRLVGMHFFNPVPLMKLVEVVTGLMTLPEVAQAITTLAKAWGKVPVAARSTPGFIVNRIARPYYAEALALLQQQALRPEQLDACLRTAGFRMGPCELMDLIGHDTNFAVTRSVFEANFYDKRYAPSLLQQEMIDGGLLGRKSGQGFYRHPDGAPPLGLPAPGASSPSARVQVHGQGAVAEQLASAVAGLGGQAPQRHAGSAWVGLDDGLGRLVLTDGRCADDWSAAAGGADVAVFDRLAPGDSAGGAGPRVLAYALSAKASPAWAAQAPAWLALLGVQPLEMADSPGLVVARTQAMLVNEAADAVAQGVCTPEGADAAMKLGVNYPQGPFEWLADWGASGVIGVLDALDACYRGERYRVSPWLRRRAALDRAPAPG